MGRGKSFASWAQAELVPAWQGGGLIVGKRSVIAVAPIEEVLCAISAGPSKFAPGTHYISVFVQPLFVPRDVFAGVISFRLGSGTTTWRIPTNGDESDALVGELLAHAVPFFAKYGSLDGLVKNAGEWSHAKNPLMLEALAYCHVLLANAEHAVATLSRAIDVMGPAPTTTPAEGTTDASVFDARERCSRIRELIDGNRSRDAQMLLYKWRGDTLDALGFADESTSP